MEAGIESQSERRDGKGMRRKGVNAMPKEERKGIGDGWKDPERDRDGLDELRRDR